MNQSEDIKENLPIAERMRRHARSLVILAFILSGCSISLYYLFFINRIGPSQPIPFSHRVHVNKKMISCVVCHSEAPFADNAGVPPIQTCMMCHSRIIPKYPPIRLLYRRYSENQPIIWKRVVNLPDYVYFSHRVHVSKQIDCGSCHGDVQAMDRVQEIVKINMGYCMSCHRKCDAPRDCYTCHR